MTATTTSPPRIYVACLAAYNNGRLHGTWIDLTELAELDELWERVNAMLKASPEPGAEEWAIHDYEGFGDWRLNEYENLGRVFCVAKLIEEHGPAMAAFIGNDESVLDGGTDIEEAFTEAYQGTWESEREYTENFVEDVGLLGIGTAKIPTGRYGEGPELDVLEALSGYLDWGALTRWATEDCWTAAVPDGVAVFRSC